MAFEIDRWAKCKASRLVKLGHKVGTAKAIQAHQRLMGPMKEKGAR